MAELQNKEALPPAEHLWRSIGFGLAELSRNRTINSVISNQGWFIDTASPLPQFNIGGIWDITNNDLIHKTAANRSPETNMTFFIGGVDPHTEVARHELGKIGKLGGQFYEYSPHMVISTLARTSNQSLTHPYLPVTTPDEIAAALRIQAEVFDFDYKEIIETMGMPPRSSHLETYLLQAGGVPVSTAQLVRDEDGKTASVWNVATPPEHQKKGYATRLLQSVIDQARWRGISYIHLMATRDGEPLYKRMGFTTIRQYGVFEIPGAYGNMHKS